MEKNVNGKMGNNPDSAFYTQVFHRIYGISRLANGVMRWYSIDTKRWYQCTRKPQAPKTIRAKTDIGRNPPNLQVLSLAILKPVSDPTESEVNKDVRYQNWMEMTLDDCWRNRQGSFSAGSPRGQTVRGAFVIVIWYVGSGCGAASFYCLLGGEMVDHPVLWYAANGNAIGAARL